MHQLAVKTSIISTSNVLVILNAYALSSSYLVSLLNYENTNKSQILKSRKKFDQVVVSVLKQIFFYQICRKKQQQQITTSTCIDSLACLEYSCHHMGGLWNV